LYFFAHNEALIAASFSLSIPKATSALCFRSEDGGFGVGDGFFDMRDGGGLDAALFPLWEDPNEGDENEVAENGLEMPQFQEA
jgi:hypothetical protein